MLRALLLPCGLLLAAPAAADTYTYCAVPDSGMQGHQVSDNTVTHQALAGTAARSLLPAAGVWIWQQRDAGWPVRFLPAAVRTAAPLLSAAVSLVVTRCRRPAVCRAAAACRACAQWDHVPGGEQNGWGFRISLTFHPSVSSEIVAFLFSNMKHLKTKHPHCRFRER
jgi:hypothetical protein